MLRHGNIASMHTCIQYTHTHTRLCTYQSGASNGTSKREFNGDNSLSFSFARVHQDILALFQIARNDSDVGGLMALARGEFRVFRLYANRVGLAYTINLFEMGNLSVYALYPLT